MRSLSAERARSPERARAIALRLLLVFSLGACGTTTARPPRDQRGAGPALGGAPPEPPAGVDRYQTDGGSEGIVGGPLAAAVARDVVAALRERGDQPQADAALAALGAWYYREVAAGRGPSSPQSEQAAARLGFVGVLFAATVFPIDDPAAPVPKTPSRDILSQLARNSPVNRFGVWAAPDGGAAVVAFAAVELSLEPFPRHFSQVGQLRLRGRLGARFARGDVYLTLPSGEVQQTAIPARAVDVLLSLGMRGVYRVEVMGDGPSGPVVLGNVPVFVGVADSELEGTASVAVGGAVPSPEAVAARMMVLLNEARRRAHVAALAEDQQLAAVAQAYCREMVAGHFFGHVSSVTGTVADRVRRAGIGVTVVGENVTQGDSAESAHQGLMSSPGHRSNMLDPRFTSAGVGVVSTGGEPPLLATIVFARRPKPERLNADDLLAEVAALRRARGVAPVAVDPILQRAAEVGLSVKAPGGGEATKDQIMDAGEAALVKEDRRLGVRRSGGCAEWLEIYEREDLKDIGILLSPDTRKIGLAAALRATGVPRPLGVLLFTESKSCH